MANDSLRPAELTMHCIMEFLKTLQNTAASKKERQCGMLWNATEWLCNLVD